MYRSIARDCALTPGKIRQFKIAFQLILMTLVRKSELMLAQWKDVHVDEGEWHIPVENSKTGKPHIVYLFTQARVLFKELNRWRRYWAVS
uniref:tyrosine-type recombinase/integrase n=1 Tax=Castellaniella defragrans TaxID=75697 RepID=UPI00333F44CD